MKTPREWSEEFDDLIKTYPWMGGLPMGLIYRIQHDAFESGRKQGIRDANDMMMKVVDPQKVIEEFNSQP